jgi:phosphonate metabolism-associated iron-containing alcohol dehydrogenase
VTEYYNPVDVEFGPGVFEANITKEFEHGGVTILTTRGTRARFLDEMIARHSLDPVAIIDDCIENPTFESCRAIHASIDFDRTTCLLGVGGGSVLDTAKAVSLHDSSPSFETIEKAIRDGKGIEAFEIVPLVAVPTTAGTGSEVTCWGSIWDNEEKKKYSISNEVLYPRRAYCDPSLTLSLPLSTTLATALDALSHSFESIWNRNASDVTRQHALGAIDLLLTHLEPLSRDLANLSERTQVMKAALEAGLAFSNTKTSVAHALSYYLTLRNDVPHGRACSFTLPHILRVFLETEGQGVLTDDHLARLTQLFDALDISTYPKDYGVSSAEFDAFFRAGTQSERMQNSVIDLRRLRDELEATYETD